MSVDVSIQCDWCRKFLDGGDDALACAQCYDELESERDSLIKEVEELKEEVASLENAALESSR